MNRYEPGDKVEVNIRGGIAGEAQWSPSGYLSATLGANCTLDMFDSYGDGWQGNVWRGFGRAFTLRDGTDAAGGGHVGR